MAKIADVLQIERTVNSYLGIMSHSASYHVRQQLFDTNNFARIIEIDGDLLKSKPITEIGRYMKR